MRRLFAALVAVPVLYAFSAFAGDAEIKSAQGTIDAQLKAFQAGDGALAYSFAAPNVKRIFPTRRHLHGHGRERLPAGSQAQELMRSARSQEMSADLDRPAGADRRSGRQGLRGRLHAGTAAGRRLPHHRRQPAGVELAEHLGARLQTRPVGHLTRFLRFRCSRTVDAPSPVLEITPYASAGRVFRQTP